VVGQGTGDIRTLLTPVAGVEGWILPCSLWWGDAQRRNAALPPAAHLEFSVPFSVFFGLSFFLSHSHLVLC
jgi:hypothetical protein